MKPNYSYGWIPQPHDDRDFLFSAIQATPPPPTADLRPQMPPVYDQSQLNSCTANAICAIVHYDLLSNQQPFTPSRLFVYYNERAMENSVNQDAGAIIRDGIKAINSLGVCSETEWGYDITKFAVKPPQPCYDHAILHKSLQYERVLQGQSTIESALAQGFPIVFGFYVKSSFESEKVANTGNYKPKSTESIVGRHAVVLVGYNRAKKQYMVRNSYGDSWGQKGHFTMPYEEVHSPSVSSDFWVIKKVS